jgi:hypothetical protein
MKLNKKSGTAVIAGLTTVKTVLGGEQRRVGEVD